MRSFFITALLRYNSETIQFPYFTCICSDRDVHSCQADTAPSLGLVYFTGFLNSWFYLSFEKQEPCQVTLICQGLGSLGFRYESS